MESRSLAAVTPRSRAARGQGSLRPEIPADSLCQPAPLLVFIPGESRPSLPRPRLAHSAAAFRTAPAGGVGRRARPLGFQRATPRWGGAARPFFLRELEFESVLGRCVLASLLLALPVCYAFRACVPGATWAGRRRGGGALRPGLCGGAPVSLLALFLLGWALGAYDVRVEPTTPGGPARCFMVWGRWWLGGSRNPSFVAFTTARSAAIGGPWTAALVSSVWFAVVHFAQPFARIGVVHATSLTGWT